jgi:cation diffusion facilitator CzcD-associated flavoprotein CzcO
VPEFETNYLVVGAGASGMAFTDALIASSDAEVVMAKGRQPAFRQRNSAVRRHGFSR